MPVTIPGNFTTTAVILSLDPTEQYNQFPEGERMFSRNVHEGLREEGTGEREWGRKGERDKGNRGERRRTGNREGSGVEERGRDGGER